jgi:carboxyl-terminal processing protease
MAAALQDYNRAIIVGCTSFGKSSGQVIIPLDTLILSGFSKSKSKNNLGYIKITINKFYRLNGVTYQQKGVIPDIMFPSVNGNFVYHEDSFPYALKSDSAVKKIYYHQLPKLPVTELEEKSRLRISTDQRFKRIDNLNDSLQMTMKLLKAIPLNLESFRKREAKSFQSMQTLETLAFRPSTMYQVTNTKFDMPIFKINPYKKEINDNLLKNIQNDIYIEEAYKIMNDLINTK